jgi:cephalosporin hydroxylase/glycosyltransferase involved in cell wall biosynthesis
MTSRTQVLVSIIISSYNYARYLRTAIDSALAQSHPRCEVIVVDDGSTDESREIIMSYEARVIPILKDNGGQASSMNAGFRASQGDVLIFLDSDDMLFPGAAECVVAALASPEISKVHWPLTIVDADGKSTGDVFPEDPLDEGELREGVIRRGVEGYVWPVTSGNAWPRWFIERMFPLPESEFKVSPDLYLCTQAPLFGTIAKVDVPQGSWRVHGENNHRVQRVAEFSGEEIRRWEYCSEELRRHFLVEGVAVDVDAWKSRSWTYQQLLAIQELAERVPPECTFLLVDEHDWLPSESILGRRRLPFLERNGQFWGAPEDDVQAIDELERMRREGAGFIVFTSAAFWWLDFYTGLRNHLLLNFRRVLDNERIVIYDLRCRVPRRGSRPSASTETTGIERLLDESVHQYWLDRIKRHFDDTYMGIPMLKFPEDLRVYEHLIFETCPNVVIELGSFQGGSALWFRDRLRTLEQYGLIQAPRVISIDLNGKQSGANVARVDPEYEGSITFLTGDVTDPATADRMAGLLPHDARCMVIEDSAHVYDTTISALKFFSRFVPVNGYFVVEDGTVDITDMRADPDWPRGVLPAVRDWLKTPQGAHFRMRRDEERYILTAHPYGFLQRLSSDEDSPS